MIPGLGTSGAGQILFGTVAGGVTSHLQGGNFWEGAAIGLIVSGLNHAMHKMADDSIDPPIKKKEGVYEDIKKTIDGLGLTGATKELIFELIENPSDLSAFASKYKSVLSGLGKTLGFASAGIAINDYINHPTTAGLVKALVNTCLASSTVISGGTLSSVVGWGMSFADSSGLTDKLYNYIGNSINNLSGYDVGLEIFHNSRSFFLQTKLNFKTN
jgi:hypothetical protein